MDNEQGPSESELHREMSQMQFEPKINRMKEIERSALENISSLETELKAVSQTVEEVDKAVKESEDSLLSLDIQTQKEEFCNNEIVSSLSKHRQMCLEINDTLVLVYDNLRKSNKEQNIFKEVNRANNEMVEEVKRNQTHTINELSNLEQRLTKETDIKKQLHAENTGKLISNAEQLEIQIREMEAENEDLLNKRNYSQTKHDEILFKINDNMEEISVIEADIETKVAYEEKEESEFESNQQTISDEVELLTCQFAVKTTQLEEYNVKTAEVENGLKNLDVEHENMSVYCDGLINENKELEANLENALKVLEETEATNVNDISEIAIETNTTKEKLDDQKVIYNNELSLMVDWEEKIGLFQENLDKTIKEVNNTEDKNRKLKVEREKLMKELEDIKKTIDEKVEEIRKPKEELAIHNAKIEITELQLKEATEGLNRDKMNICEQIEETKLQMNTKSKELLEELKNLRQDENQQREDINNRLKQEFANIQEEKNSIDTEISNTKAKINQCISNKKTITLQIDILKRQIKTLELIRMSSQQSQPSPQQLLPPAVVPKKRNWDELSDSSMEGSSYAPHRLSLAKKTQERKRLAKAKKAVRMQQQN